ncbi:MAG TPA: hypothetical protein VFF30_07635 [Nitrososphaerales archaeon]|nr:hypothetical protein [Nitrososphaerales archaeon]
MGTSIDEANPSDKNVERSIKEERKFLNKGKYSIAPPGFEESGLEGEETKEMEDADAKTVSEEDFEELSSDKEEDTTEGEITDTHTSD